VHIMVWGDVSIPFPMPKAWLFPTPLALAVIRLREALRPPPEVMLTGQQALDSHMPAGDAGVEILMLKKVDRSQLVGFHIHCPLRSR
jgi:hypothetical protein